MPLLRHVSAGLFALAAIGCNGGDLLVPADPQAPTGVPSAERSTVAAAPSLVEAVTGTATIIVTVREANGDPVQGATVTLSGTGSEITLIQPAAATGADGVTTGTLRSAAPGTKVVSAVISGSVAVSQSAQVTVTTAPATVIEVLAGNNQRAPAGQDVPEQPAVRVIDALGEPVAGFEVSFVVTGGGGILGATTQATNSDGIARVRWTLGQEPGANTMEARAGSLVGSPVVFTAEGTASPAPREEDVDRLVYLVPPPSTVKKGESFSVRVALVDQAGNVVPLNGIFTYLNLYQEGDGDPTNTLLRGEHFENTENGVAVLDIRIEKKGRYRLQALTDDLPALGPHGPEPYLMSDVFRVD